MGKPHSLRRRGFSVGVLGVLSVVAVPLSCGESDRTYGDDSAGTSGTDAGGGGEDTGGTSTGGRGGSSTGGRGGTATGGRGNDGGAPEGGSGNSGGSDAGAGNEGGDSGSAGAPEGGTGGMGGTNGGMAGSTAGGGAGGGGGCTFVSAEDCFNGRDDDCNGTVDAADTACSSSTQCVPAATAFSMGILLAAAGSCPATYANSELALNRALNAGAGCTGCSCNASIQCSAQVYEYTTLAQCDGDTTLTGGTLQGSVGPTDMCLNNANLIAGPGFRVGPYTTTNGACTPAGTATRSTPTWGASQKFCGTNLVGGGCSAGSVAIPRTTERRCVVALGAQSCPTGYLPETNPWYTGFDDTRTCGACTCGTQTPGDCTRTATGSAISVQLYFGTSETCSAGIHRSAGSNSKNCTVIDQTDPHNSMGFSSASPLLPSCPPVSAVSGAATPTGQYTMCCAI